MSLEPGTSLTHYTLREKIGKGGMGEVFRAADTKLGRDVAIKILPEEVARDPDRLARFRREAQLLASLNHPNIAAIHGIEESGGISFLVLEMVEGEDLAQRLGRGPVPLEETLGIARQLADGLEEAHEHGIIHRDLKPANVKVTPEGKVKILDFGLGKAFEAPTSESGDPSLSPTLTAAATRAGVIMGTAAYMSPEQARGGSVDKRADIWAFGCVLLEMLTGARTFAGDTISDTLAAVLRADPDWSALPAGISPALRRLLERCLEKDRKRRLRDIGEARLAIEAILSGASGGDPERPAAAAPARTTRRWPAVIAAVVATAAVTAGLMLLRRPGPPDLTLEKYAFHRPGLTLDEYNTPDLSPDGRRILFSTPEGLWVRDLAALDPVLLAGTEQASHPAWSPDGTSIAYESDGGLWRIPARGGQAVPVVVGLEGFGDSGSIAWASDDRIVFASGGGALYEVPSRGGEARVLVEPDRKEVQDIHHVSALPDGRGILYVAHRAQHTFDTIMARAGGASRTVLQLEDQEIRTPVYSSSGHILYVRQTGNTGLWALPFSLSTLTAEGEPFLVARDGSLPRADRHGSILYARNARAVVRQMVWVDREGNETGTVGPPSLHLQSPSISPDGRRVAVMAQEGESRDIWIHDIQRGTRLRLTFTQQPDWDPAWSPDGTRVLFWDGTTRMISVVPADGTGTTEPLVTETFADSGVPSLSSDGKILLFWVRNPDTKGDLYTMPMEGDRKFAPFLRTPFEEDEGWLSPDDRYVAYVSDEAGARQVYLTRFPGGEGKWQVSVNGGQNPRWDPRGGRVYYFQGRDVMEVVITDGPSPILEAPRRLFTLDWAYPQEWWANRFAVSPDGRRFLFTKNLKSEGEEASLVLVRNWTLDFAD